MKKLKLNPKIILIVATIIVLVGAIAFVSIRLIATSTQKKEVPIPTPIIQKKEIEPLTYTLNVDLDATSQEATEEASISATTLPKTSEIGGTTPSPTQALFAQNITPTSPFLSTFSNVSPTSSQSTSSIILTPTPTVPFLQSATSAPTTASPSSSTSELPASGATTYSTIILSFALLLVALSFVF